MSALALAAVGAQLLDLLREALLQGDAALVGEAPLRPACLLAALLLRQCAALEQALKASLSQSALAVVSQSAKDRWQEWDPAKPHGADRLALAKSLLAAPLLMGTPSLA